MDAKKLSIEDCKNIEDKLTRQAVQYANLIKTPEERAQAAKEVIAGLPDQQIRLAHETTQSASAEDLNTLKGTVHYITRHTENLDARIKACTTAIKDTQEKNDQYLCGMYSIINSYDERLSNYEKILKEIESKKSHVHKMYQAIKNWLTK